MKRPVTKNHLRQWLFEMFPEEKENLNTLLDKWLTILPFSHLSAIISHLHDEYISNPHSFNKSLKYLSTLIHKRYRMLIDTEDYDVRGFKLKKITPGWWKHFTLRKL